MSAVLAAKDIPAIGAAFGGGFVTDRILVDQRPHLIVTASKAEGERTGVRWNKNLKKVPGARSYFDSYANTLAMAEAGSEIAQWALEQRIGGEKDWCIAARDVLERQYFRLKPTTRPNACWYRDGENPSAIPAAYAYTPEVPAQTELALFRAGGAEALEVGWYWSSTEYPGDDAFAYAQRFGYGGQNFFRKGDECSVRLVRLIEI